MYKDIKIHTCDRCGTTIYDNDDSTKILIFDNELDLCSKCGSRFRKFWNEFFKPDIGSGEIPFKVNEKMLFK